jgi:hypothetical protein
MLTPIELTEVACTSERQIIDNHQLVTLQRILTNTTDLLIPTDIRQHGLCSLYRQLSIRVSIDKLNDTKFLVHLHNIREESPFHSQIVKECCGLTLCATLDQPINCTGIYNIMRNLDTIKCQWKVVALPFMKIFDYTHEEAKSLTLHWPSTRLYTKLDGVLACLYSFEDVWHVELFSSAPPYQQITSTTEAYTQLFWNIWKESSLDVPTDQTKCYMFEMCSKNFKSIYPHYSIFAYEEDIVTPQNNSLSKCI